MKTDHTGIKYGDWTVLEDAPRKCRTRAVVAQCQCGTVKTVILAQIVGGTSKSCGCLKPRLRLAGAYSDEKTSWKSNEIKIIEQHYPTGGSAVCHKLIPHRSRQSIRAKASNFKIRRQRWDI